MGGFGVADGAERGLPAQPTVGSGHSAGKLDVDLGRQLCAVAEGDQVDVLAEAPVGEVGAGERGAPDEVESIRESRGDRREEIRDQVVAFHLLRLDAELGCDSVTFVKIHGVAAAQISPRLRLATIRCSRASSSSRSGSLRR